MTERWGVQYEITPSTLRGFAVVVNSKGWIGQERPLTVESPLAARSHLRGCLLVGGGRCRSQFGPKQNNAPKTGYKPSAIAMKRYLKRKRVNPSSLSRRRADGSGLRGVYINCNCLAFFLAFIHGTDTPHKSRHRGWEIASLTSAPNEQRVSLTLA